jgi:hypothetical protein
MFLQIGLDSAAASTDFVLSRRLASKIPDAGGREFEGAGPGTEGIGREDHRD